MPFIGTDIPDVDRPLLVYAGHTFRITKISLWETRPVYAEDGTDRLYLHHRIGVQAVWNPYATRTGDGVAPFVSIATIRETILRRGLQLKITTGGATILESPLPRPAGGNYYVDARNGPNPIALNVLKILGTESVIAYFEIETWVPSDCSGNRLSIVSHRWQQQEKINRNGWVTRYTRGKAVFRTDVLLDRGYLPDDFRARLFHPVPRRFLREDVDVNIGSDGTSLEYSFTDSQQAYAILAYDKAGNRLPSSRSWFPTLTGTWRQGFTNLELDPLKPAFHYINFSAQVWGKPEAPTQGCVEILLAAAGGFSFLNLNNFPLYHKADLSIDVMGKHATLDVGIFIDGKVANFLNAADFALFPPFVFVRQVFGDNGTGFPEGIPNVTQNPLDGDMPQNLGGLNSSRARTVLYKLVHESLTNPCDTPQPPGNVAGINGPVGNYPNDSVLSVTF